MMIVTDEPEEITSADGARWVRTAPGFYSRASTVDEIIKSLREAFLAVEPGIWECVKDAARKVEDAPRLRRSGPKRRRETRK